MGPPRGTDSPCRIPIRLEQMKQTGSSSRHRPRSPPSRISFKGYSSRPTGRSSGVNYKQSVSRVTGSPEESYLPPQRTNNRKRSPSFEKDFAPFGSVYHQRYFANETEDIASMFRRPDYEDRSASYRIMEAACSTNPINGSNEKAWDAGVTRDCAKDNSNPLLRASQLPPPNQPIIKSVPSSSRRNINRSEDLDRILAKYGKSSRSNLNAEKDPDFMSVIRTDATLRVTTDRYCKPQSGISAHWNPNPENDILSKLNCALKPRPASLENLNDRLAERTVQLPGPDGPVLAPMHPIEKDVDMYQVSPIIKHFPEKLSPGSDQSNAVLRRSTHVFPFKETQSGHLVIDPIQIAFESRKISVLVSDPNNNTTTVEFTTNKAGANSLLFQPSAGNPAFVNKNERILHEVKKAMSIQESNDISNRRNTNNSKLPMHQQPRELNSKKYSESKKATVEFEDHILARVTSGKNADTHVMIGDKIYPCHSVALEAFSTYFERLSRPPESIQRIQLPETEVSVSAFPILMDWIVQSEDGRKDIPTKESLVSVYAAARHLGVKDLELQCIAFLERKVDPNDPDLLSLWDDVKKKQTSCPELVRIIAGKLAASYHDIYKSKKYLQMEVDELYMLLNSDDISIDSEMEVYDSAITWLVHDWKNRKVHTNRLMSAVRFGLLSPLQLTQINLCPETNKVKSEKDYNQIVTYGTVKSMIDDGLAYSILDESYKNQPEELKKWVDKTGVKAPAARSCLLSKKRGSPLILEKISLLEDASQTKLLANFNKLPEKSSSYTLLDTKPRPGTPHIESSQELDSSNLSDGVTLKDQQSRSRIPKPPFGGNGTQSPTLHLFSSHQGSAGHIPVQELSKPKLLSNSSNTLHQIRSDTDRMPDAESKPTNPCAIRDPYDNYSIK